MILQDITKIMNCVRKWARGMIEIPAGLIRVTDYRKDSLVADGWWQWCMTVLAAWLLPDCHSELLASFAAWSLWQLYGSPALCVARAQRACA